MALLCAVAVGLLVPLSSGVRSVLGGVSTGAIVVLFFLYGARLPTGQVLAGVRNLRLQGAVLAMTFVFFPLLGLLVSTAFGPVLGNELSLGVLYLCLLPSTIQSSVVMTGIAGGNTAAAITAATLSNVLGMAVTPVYVLLFAGVSGVASTGSPRSVLWMLLAPFLVGQLLQRLLGGWLRAHRPFTTAWDRSTIVLVVLVAVSGATARGVWQLVELAHLAVLALVSVGVLAVALICSWWWGRGLRLPWGDRVTLLMCGSQKSLATGMPMLAALFPATVAGPVAVPVIVFHQLQLLVTSVLARQLARRRVADNPGW